MKNEFALAFNELLEEKGLPKEIIVTALEAALVSAYRRAVTASSNQNVRALVDLETGKITIFADKEVVEDVQSPLTEVLLEEARKYEPEAQLGDLVMVESTPDDFGRVAAQTARQVIQQKIRDAERDAQKVYYETQVGEIVNGVVQAVSAQGLTIGLEMKAEGSMPRKEMIPGERFYIRDHVRALVAEVKESTRGPQIILSRTHRNFLRRLLETEIPEIYHGVVEIRSISREPGERAKVAVSATQAGVEPVGACVGVHGVRIKAIVRELNDEKIDVIPWSDDPAEFISKAISPARVSGVYLNERSLNGKTATVVVPEDQLSLAIGRDGQNARLAAKLTGWRIDIKSVPEAAADALYKLQNDPTYLEFAEAEKETAALVEDMLARRADNKPLTPEEFTIMGKFIDRVERRAVIQRAEEKGEDTELIEARAKIPASAFELDIFDSSLPEHVSIILQENGYDTLGSLALQMLIQPDDILRLQGIGVKARDEINRVMEELQAQLLAEQEAAEAALVEPEPEAIVEAPEPEVVEASPEVLLPEPMPIEVTEEEPTFEEIFAQRPEVTVVARDEDEEETDSTETGDKKKKDKKKKKSVTIEYDPDKDATIVRKQHKRGDGWDWES